MVQAWFMDDSDADQRLEHKLDPPEYLQVEELKALCGVLYWKLDAKTYVEDGKLEQIKKERGYTYADICEMSKEKMGPDYEKTIKMFYEEHLHTDEEIRFTLDGSGYFDVRDRKDRWIRILVERGDLLIVPAGIYHRFTMDSNNYVKTMRLFVGEPVWTPHNRPADNVPARQEYLAQLERGF